MAEPRTPGQLLLRRAAEARDAPLLIDAADGARRTRAEVLEQALRWAAFLRAGGLGIGDRAAAALPNTLEHAALLLGASLAGVTLCSYSPGLADEELVSLAARFGPRLALVTPGRLESLGGRLPIPTHAVDRTFAASLPPPADPALAAEVDPRAPYVLIMTSGTTGGLKACRVTGANVLHTAATNAAVLGRHSGEVFLTPLPLFHINAIAIGLLTSLHSGGALAVGTRLAAPLLWQAAARTGAVGMSTVPAIIHDLLASPGSAPPGLRYVVSSSAPLPPAVQQQFRERFGIPVLQCYGLSESGGFATYGSPEAPLGSVGRAHGCEVQVMPASKGGEVLVRGAGIFDGYDGDVAATQQVLEGGWLHTGDTGVLDDQGWLFLRGRLKDLVNRGGEKVSPDAVEAVVRELPGVAEAAVFGIPDARLGEEVAVAIVPKDPARPPSEAELWEGCACRLGEVEIPKRWFVCASLPRGSTGKVLRRVLREQYAAQITGK